MNGKSSSFILSSPSLISYFCFPLKYFSLVTEIDVPLKCSWTAAYALFEDMHTRQKMAGCSFGYVLAPRIPQL